MRSSRLGRAMERLRACKPGTATLLSPCAKSAHDLDARSGSEIPPQLPLPPPGQHVRQPELVSGSRGLEASHLTLYKGLVPEAETTDP